MLKADIGLLLAIGSIRRKAVIEVNRTSPVKVIKINFMKLFYKTLFIILIITSSACTVPVRQSQNKVTHDEHYVILDVLSKQVDGFSYEGSTTYPAPWGYSLRYRNNESKRTYADIYIYPVPREAVDYKHKDIVFSITNDALHEIDYAKERGVYSKFNVISKGTFEILDNVATKVEISLVKDNLVSYSLLFVTESSGKIIKARMTMPDNELNRNNEAWNKFVAKTFSIILKNIEKA